MCQIQPLFHLRAHDTSKTDGPTLASKYWSKISKNTGPGFDCPTATDKSLIFFSSIGTAAVWTEKNDFLQFPLLAALHNVFGLNWMNPIIGVRARHWHLPSLHNYICLELCNNHSLFLSMVFKVCLKCLSVGCDGTLLLGPGLAPSFRLNRQSIMDHSLMYFFLLIHTKKKNTNSSK